MLHLFYKCCVSWNMFSVDFGTFSSEGYPHSLPKEAIVKPSGAIRCPDVFFLRFLIGFGGENQHENEKCPRKLSVCIQLLKMTYVHQQMTKTDNFFERIP